MRRTEVFRQQHKELLELVGQIDKLLKPGELAIDSSPVSQLLPVLSGKLRLHLKAEEKALYPVLINHQDETLRALALKYQKQMGGLAGKYEEYAQRWHTKASIEMSAEAFVKETKAVFQALGERIAREDNELYELYDKAESAL